MIQYFTAIFFQKFMWKIHQDRSADAGLKIKCLNKFQKIEISQKYVSNDSGLKLEINKNKRFRKILKYLELKQYTPTPLNNSK